VSAFDFKSCCVCSETLEFNLATSSLLDDFLSRAWICVSMSFICLWRPWMSSVDGNWENPADNAANIAWVRESFRHMVTSAGTRAVMSRSDLGHILERSQVAATVEYERIPRGEFFRRLDKPELEKDCVLSGGDDYELLFTVPQAQRGEVDALAAELKLALTRIGTVEAGSGLRIVDATGKPVAHRGGFDHFAR